MDKCMVGPEQQAFRASFRSGFTLIELLVVVLIIGILAAVALPQYEKAVLKSRLTQSLTRVNALNKAADVYYMGSGFYPLDIRDLDIDITAGASRFERTSISNEASHIGAFYPDGTQCAVTPSGSACGDKYFYIVQMHADPVLYCRGITAAADAVCRSMARGAAGTGSGEKYQLYPIQQ